jgi:beta-galactosidase
MTPSRRHVEWLKTGWTFTRGNPPDAADPAADDRAWEAVRVPHDWAITGPFDRENDIQYTAILEDGETKQRAHTGRTGGLPHVGRAWYRRRLTLPADLAGLRFRLEFDGVMSRSQVYVNGRLVGVWPYGYASFAFDITEAVRSGENLVAVSVDNPPDASRWYPGAGIYRHVRLVTLPATHVGHWGVWVATESVDDRAARISVRTEIQSHGPVPPGAVLESLILDPDGRDTASVVTALGAAPAQQVRQELQVPAPARWSLESPRLYTLRSLVRAEGRVLDACDTRFGIRTLAFDAREGFLLNGRRTPLQGVCMHHDLGPLGSAVNTAALRRQLRILQDMGCNALRTSHNPPAPELLDLADEMGFLVIDEAFDEWKLGKVGNGYHTLFEAWAERDLRAMIRRDRNHPSVILWSLGNEIREQADPDGRAVARFLHDIARDEDPTRPTTAAFNQSDAAIANGLAEVVDVPGWNYKPDRYGAYRARFPNKPMYGSETASCISSRGEYYFPVEEERGPVRDTNQVNSFDLSVAGWANCPDIEFRGLDDTPSLMGEFVWTGFDYLGEPTPYGEAWPSRSSYFGIVDLCGLPKDRFYLYRSRWSNRPTLHLLPHWTWPGREGLTTPVHCYTSWNAVELFLNGRSQGRRTRNPKNLAERYRLIWAGVVYEPGELKAVAYDDKGRPAGECVVRTAGAPAALRLEPEQTEFYADGEDMAFVAFHVCDRAGTRCPRADHLVTFRVSGPAELAALDNGNAASTELFTGSAHRAFNGSGMVYLRAKAGAAGEVTLDASADGLAPARLTLRTRPRGT